MQDIRKKFFEASWRSKLSRWGSPAGMGQTLAHLEIAFDEAMEQTARETALEEHQFFLNMLDGIDIADKEAGNAGGGTQALRFLIKSRWPNGAESAQT